MIYMILLLFYYQYTTTVKQFEVYKGIFNQDLGWNE